MEHVKNLNNLSTYMQDKTKKDQYWYNLLVVAAFSYNSILRYIIEVFERIPFINYFSGFIVPIMYIFLIAMCLKGIFSFVRLRDILFIFVFIIMLLLTWLIRPENGSYIREFLPEILFIYIPFYFLGLSFITNKSMIKWLYRVSLLALMINWAYLAYYYSTGRVFHIDSMYESYTMLLHVMIIVWITLRKLTITKLMFSIAGFLYLLSMGTRGPIVILLAFIAIYIIFKSARDIKIKILVFILFFVLSYLFLFTNVITEIIKWISTIIESMGLSTRVLDSYLYGHAQDSIDERSNIYTLLWSALLDKPITGYGIYGEYPFIGWSAHNLYLQMCFEFGLIVGPILIMVFISISAQAIFRNLDPIAKEFALIWVCYIFVQGFFGGNVISFYVFFSLGYFLRQIRLKKYYIKILRKNR